MSTPDMWEAKYVPISSSETTLEEKEGMAKALQKLAQRKFASFEKEMNGMLDRTYYEEGDSNIVKEKKKETDTFTDKYEEAICWLESSYSGEKGAKRTKELKDIDENYKVLEERRDSVRRLVKEVNAKIDDWKNNEALLAVLCFGVRFF